MCKKERRWGEMRMIALTVKPSSGGTCWSTQTRSPVSPRPESIGATDKKRHEQRTTVARRAWYTQSRDCQRELQRRNGRNLGNAWRCRSTRSHEDKRYGSFLPNRASAISKLIATQGGFAAVSKKFTRIETRCAECIESSSGSCSFRACSRKIQ